MDDIKEYVRANSNNIRTTFTNSDNKGGISKGYLV